MNRTILLVEDNLDDEALTLRALKKIELTYDVVVAHDGVEALAFLRREGKYANAARPDLILLDIMMPVLDGFEVLARLKANPTTRDIPVIVISAQSDLRSVVRGIQLGAEDYLPKPFEPTLLHGPPLSVVLPRPL